jgi:hypothetical protein
LIFVWQGWSKWEPGDKKEDGKRDREICPVKKGYGMSVSGMRPLEGATLYSVMDKLPRTLSCTLEKSRAKQSEWQGQFPSIKDLIQTNALPFFVSKVNPDVSIDMDSRSISLEDGHVQQICLQGWVPQVCFCFSFTCFSKHSLALNFVSCAV